jgi:hypothetical protein
MEVLSRVICENWGRTSITMCSAATGTVFPSQKCGERGWSGVNDNSWCVEMVGLAKDFVGDLRGGQSNGGVKGTNNSLLSLPISTLLEHAH